VRAAQLVHQTDWAVGNQAYPQAGAGVPAPVAQRGCGFYFGRRGGARRTAAAGESNGAFASETAAFFSGTCSAHFSEVSRQAL